MVEEGRWRVLRGPLWLGLVYAITSVLALPALGARAAGSVSSALGILAGLLGITGFALNIILGARLPGAPRLLGGLERLYALHRANGRVAYLFILLHVCLITGDIALDSASSALDLVTFRAGTVITLGAVAFLGMTAALAATLYARLTHETFVYVQRSFGLLFVLAAFHAFLTPGFKGSSAALTTYLAALALVAFAAFAYRSLLGNLLVRRFDYAVSRVTELDRFVIEIEMIPLERALNARPGQFVFVTFYSQSFEARFHPVSVASEGDSAVVVLRPGDARDQFHPFSLTSTPADRHLSLVIKAVGDFTTALHALEAGARARVEGPYGEFSYLGMPRRRQVWIAGGIGITPFLSMARSRPGSDFSIDLFWGVNDRGRAYFAEELAALAAELPSFRFHLVPEDEVGFITSGLLREKTTLDHADILIVGPPPMERSLRGQLRAAGVPARHIHSERFAFGAPSSR